MSINLAWTLSLSLSLFPSVSQFSAILVESWSPFQIVTTSTLKTSVLWNMTPWIFVYKCKVLGRVCSRHNRSRISWISLNMEKASSNETSVPYINLFIFISQQSEIFISNALLISNLAQAFFGWMLGNIYKSMKKIKQSLFKPCGLQEVEASRFLDNRSGCHPCVPPRNIPGTHLC